jgi:hypothetical protein
MGTDLAGSEPLPRAIVLLLGICARRLLGYVCATRFLNLNGAIAMLHSGHSQ